MFRTVSRVGKVCKGGVEFGKNVPTSEPKDVFLSHDDFYKALYFETPE
jgi:hypothetical protein